MNRAVFLTLSVVVAVSIRATGQTDDGENIILGKPTASSIVIHALADANATVLAEYGTVSGRLANRTNTLESSPDGTAVIVVDGLEANTRYFYRLRYRDPGEEEFRPGEEYSFHTQRPRGAMFSFGVQGDSHPERVGNMYSPDLYALTMKRVAEDRPDLYFMLGDDFSISPQVPNFYQGDRSTLTQRFVDDVYLNQRRFLGLMANSTALFPVNGNHEEARRSLLGTELHEVSIFAGRARNRYFPVPTADAFYSGNPEPVEDIGLLGDYFSFEWGDALFLSLDPYWHSTEVTERIGGMGMGTAESPPWDEIVDEYNELTQPKRDLWLATIGDTQYEWFKTTLEESDAEYKFVFTHHVLGTGRGGIERATKYEWGGYTDDGVWEFDFQRPDWELPIHQLMVENGVTIFFQAHDHIFAHQELDGVVYQSVPNPADDTYTARNRNAYLTGAVFDNSGYLNVTVEPDSVNVDYIRSYLPEHESVTRKNGNVDYSYTIE